MPGAEPEAVDGVPDTFDVVVPSDVLERMMAAIVLYFEGLGGKVDTADLPLVDAVNAASRLYSRAKEAHEGGE